MFRNPIFKSLLFRLTSLNLIIITLAIIVSSFAIYQTACLLVESLGNLNTQQQERFESLLLQYLIIFAMLTILIGSLLHFYLTKTMIKPIKEMIHSTKKLKEGTYPEQVQYTSDDEIGELVYQYNELINQLERNNQLRKKMISDLSHEIRTPISNLNGYLYALKNGDLDYEQTIFESLHSESEHLKQLINQLDQLKEWDIVKSQRVIQLEEVDISEIINRCIAIFNLEFEQLQIQIETQIDSKRIKIQPDGIQQVVTNLIDNALNYHTGTSPVVIEGSSDNEGYVFSITSEGNEVPEHESENIFKRFYRLDEGRSRKSGGSGLGLAIAKEIIDKHDGSIGLNSNGHLHTFWFKI
ncbi:two-component system sensor histidine kinase BaeS [Aquisalibacillus elongatus]|uniref:histidine kinase n=1 Tax=Aquisalibacillus elongatus TaxID=485577 RepID=A0A3N5BEM0_9BACI|nr:two-component system sensor histidine kinase BaeS [Aquisalibacillus elongatus]